MDNLFPTGAGADQRHTHPANAKRIAKLVGIEGLQNLVAEFPNVELDSIKSVLPTKLKNKPKTTNEKY